MKAIRKDRRYTYADYAKWNDEARYELIDGVPYAMSPAPSPVHQRISGRLHGQLWQFLKGRSCEVFAAPFDVRLNAAGDDDDIVVQPDLSVVCDKSKLDDKGCNGAPDMVLEILSASSESRDKVLKFNRYLQAGVREYWMVDPDGKTVQVCILDKGKYVISAYADTDAVPVHVLEGCTISLPDVFADL